MALIIVQFSSVAHSCPTLCDSMARPPCPSPTPGVYSNSCPSGWWCHLAISPSVVPFSCLQSFPISRSFLVSQLFASGGQSIGCFSLSISHSNEHSGLISFTIDWFDLLAFQGTLKSLLQCHSSKTSILLGFLYSPTLTSIPFLPSSKHLLISWLQSPSSVILEPRKIKLATVSTVSPSICCEVWDQMPWS